MSAPPVLETAARHTVVELQQAAQGDFQQAVHLYQRKLRWQRAGAGTDSIDRHLGKLTQRMLRRLAQLEPRHLQLVGEAVNGLLEAAVAEAQRQVASE